MILLFSITLFVSALLLFAVQPMMGKMLLPVFGGAPAVWQTALVFFQAMLLAGYAYAHAVTQWLAPKPRLLLHACLLAAAAAVLPLSLKGITVTPEMTSDYQAEHLLWVLLRVVGLPFFVLSSTSPLLQRWFSTTSHHSAKDPYYLSVASNLGSFVALFAFPLCVEPSFVLNTASQGWRVGYGILCALLAVCAIRSGQWHPDADRKKVASTDTPKSTIRWRQRGEWVAMAAVPSSLMLGLTTFVTTEIASIPLLGILPLALYLATFIFAFAQKRILSVRLLSAVLPYAVLCLAFQIFTEVTHPILIIVALHLVFFFVAALLCHTRLADTRPDAGALTEFYLWMSVGGVIGGLFNALLAPVLFRGIVEYPLAIVLACLFRPARTSQPDHPKRRLLDVLIPIGIGVVMLVCLKSFESVAGLEAYPRKIAVFSVGAVLSFVGMDRPLRLALGLAVVFWVGAQMDSLHGKQLYVERNFFGVSRVTLDPDGRSHRMVHGNTIHGRQNVVPDWSCEPLTYFHRSGPLGRVFRWLEDSGPNPRVGITGLGCGAIAGYARAGQSWDYYEIDPAVIRIAADTNLFRFLKGCSPIPIRIIAGDARLRFREAKEHEYRLIIMDAFSSDSIPLHLLTREALVLYLSKLEPDGLLAVNISNRYLDLTPVVAALAADAHLFGYHWEDPFEVKEAGKEPSHWAVLARQSNVLDRFRKDERWKPLAPPADRKVWTDDFSNVLSVMKW